MILGFLIYPYKVPACYNDIIKGSNPDMDL